MIQVITLLVIYFFSISLSANQGTGSSGTRGGGDLTEWSFYDLAGDVAATLQKSSDPIVTSAVSDLLKSLSCLSIEVSLKEYLNLDGRSVSAINYPDQCKIVLSRAVWRDYAKKEERVRLVLHELLSLARLDDRQYLLSKKLTKNYFHLRSQAKADHAQSVYFSMSGDFIVPPGVKKIKVLTIGSGGGGGGGHLNFGSGGGGGGGGAVRAGAFLVKPGEIYKVSVGSGGKGGIGGGVDGETGGSSSFGPLISAKGGGGGLSGTKKGKSVNARGGQGGGSGGGGGGNGILEVCSGAGGVAGSNGENGFVAKEAGLGGRGQSWTPVGGIIGNVTYAAGEGGRCVGPVHTYNGGGGGGGLVLNNMLITAQAGTSAGENYTGSGGTGGTGFGAGGGGGTGGSGSGGQGAPGIVYVEY